jgi:hypothetical protein
LSIENNSSEELAAFEGLFGFLSYQTTHHNQEHPLTNFLVLNSLLLFKKSRDLLEKHNTITLYLDRDKAGLKKTREALRISKGYKDASSIYGGYKDINDWLTVKRTIKQQRLNSGEAFVKSF